MMPKNWLPEKVQRVFSSGFLRDVAKLSIGTIIGRSLLILMMPLLTRLYSPENFGLLAAFLAVVTTLSVVASFRLDVAITLSPDDDEAANLLVLSVMLVFGVAFVMLLGVLAAYLWFPQLLADYPLTEYAWLIPFGVLITGLYSPLQLWSTRHRRFGEIAYTRVTQSILGVSTMLVGGLLHFVPTGLLIGNVFASGAGGLKLAYSAFKRDQHALRTVSFSRMHKAAKANVDYPRYSTLETFLNIAGIQLPVLMIASYATESAGYLFLAMQVMFAPMKLVGGSLSQVFASRGPENLANGTLRAITLEVMINSAKTFILPVLAVGIGFYLLAGPVFGDQWSTAGSIAIWMLPWAFVQFVASPVSTVMYLVGWQKRLLVVRLFTFLIRVSAVAAAIRLLPQNQVPIVFCIANFAVYSIMAGLFVLAANSISKKDSQ